MYNVYLFQPQYSVEFRKETNYWLPYSAGCLWSYASQFSEITENFDLKELIFKRDPHQAVLDRLDNPKLCGFSCYTWNEYYCIELAKKIKQHWPDCIIVFGGPQAGERMSGYDFIDSVVLSEGELAFTELLKTIIAGETIKSVYPRSRLKDLDIPSPYITGVFDKIVNEHPDAIWAMTLETNRGCPYACTFCDWGGLTYSKVAKFKLGRIIDEMSWAAKNRVAYIFNADANFGIFKERDLEIAKIIRQAADNSRIETVNLQYAKNSTETVFEIARIMGPLSRGVTFSMQSMHDLTLDAIKRKNMETNNISYLLELSRKYDISTYSELILGLPEETKESWITGLNQLLELGQHQAIDAWLCQLFTNSELATEESRRKYEISTVMVKDYMSLGKNDEDIPESIEIINSTNTMTTEEMIDCYMYSWMIIQFHTMGYTQIIAKYARNIAGIAYRTFYDEFFDAVQQDPVFKDHYTAMRFTVKNYLYYGLLGKDSAGGHALHAGSCKFMYEHKHQAARLALSVLQTLTSDVTTDLLDLQNSFTVDANATYPISLQTNYNVETGSKTPTNYTATSRVEGKLEDFYALRRQGRIKNLLVTS